MIEGKSLDDILEMIYRQEITIRKASQLYGYSRDIIRTALVKRYGTNSEELKKLESILEQNKVQSTTVEVDQVLLEEVFWKAMYKEITLKQAGEILGITDKETLRNKIFGFVQNSNDKTIKKLYENYMSNRYQNNGINFRKLAIRMMSFDLSQTDMASMLGISPRTISREFEKFSQDDDKQFYYILKSYNEAKMRKKQYTQDERLELYRYLEKYEKDNEELLEAPAKSKDELQFEKELELVEEAKKLEKEGLTQKQIADRLGTSVSSLRRAKINCQRRSLIGQIQEENDPHKEPNFNEEPSDDNR